MFVLEGLLADDDFVRDVPFGYVRRRKEEEKEMK